MRQRSRTRPEAINRANLAEIREIVDDGPPTVAESNVESNVGSDDREEAANFMIADTHSRGTRLRNVRAIKVTISQRAPCIVRGNAIYRGDGSRWDAPDGNSMSKIPPALSLRRNEGRGGKRRKVAGREAVSEGRCYISLYKREPGREWSREYEMKISSGFASHTRRESPSRTRSQSAISLLSNRIDRREKTGKER